MDNTVTVICRTRWEGEPVPPGKVFRVPEDITIDTARRWVTKHIAEIGGEWVPNQRSVPAVPFKDLEEDLDEEMEDRIDALTDRSKDDLLDMAKSRLIDVPAKATKAAIARLLVTTPED